MEDNKILVSISCVTYNQESYIAQALESFLMQKTEFEFEILVHDDASTDGTANIIKEYELKYHNRIKPIYQSENQYSKGVNVNQFNDKRALGKYIAYCEGDDYWTDPYKLQKQVDYMKTHPECSLCVHAACTVDHLGKQLTINKRPNQGNKNYSTKEILLAGGGMFASNSMLHRSDLVQNMPAFYYNAPVGDFPLQIYLSMHGEVYYIDEFMSTYRMNARNSWTNDVNFNDSRIIEISKKMEIMFNGIDEYSNGKYFEIIRQCILANGLYIAMLENNKFKIKVIRKQVDFDLFNLNYRKYRLLSRIPWLYQATRRLKQKLAKMKVQYRNDK